MSATTISARERLPPTRKDPLPDVRASSTLASAATFVLEEAQFLKDVRSISSHSSMRGEALVSDDDSPMSEMLAFTAPPPPQSNNRLIAGTKAESRSPENGRYTYLPFEQQRIRRGKLFVTYFTPSFLVSFKLACSRRFSKVFRRLCCRPKKESGESTLKTHQYRGLPLIHARIKYGSIEEFSMFFKTALRYHQNDLGLLFQKDRECQTACERAFKKFWKK